MSRIVRCAQMLCICLWSVPLLAAAQIPDSPTPVALPAPLPVGETLRGDPSGAPQLVLPSPSTALKRPVPEVMPSLLPATADIVQAAPEKKIVEVRVPGDGPHMAGTLVAQTARLDLYVGAHSFDAAQIAQLAPMIEQLLRNDEAHFGTRLDHRVSVAFYQPARAPLRGVRGMAYTDEQRAAVFYGSNEDVERALTVVAHELGHHLEAQRYGDAAQHRADTMLHEGLATWIAGDRWLAKYGTTSWRDRAKQLHAQGLPRALLTAETCGANNAYELWASFVDFLVQRYGWEKFDALYSSGRGRAPGSSDYRGVLGVPLETLAVDWRAWVDE